MILIVLILSFASNVTNYELKLPKRKKMFSFTKFSKNEPMKIDETGMKLKVEFFPNKETTEINNAFTAADNTTNYDKNQECKTADNKSFQDCIFSNFM